MGACVQGARQGTVRPKTCMNTCCFKSTTVHPTVHNSRGKTCAVGSSGRSSTRDAKALDIRKTSTTTLWFDVTNSQEAFVNWSLSFVTKYKQMWMTVYGRAAKFDCQNKLFAVFGHSAFTDSQEKWCVSRSKPAFWVCISCGCLLSNYFQEIIDSTGLVVWWSCVQETHLWLSVENTLLFSDPVFLLRIILPKWWSAQDGANNLERSFGNTHLSGLENELGIGVARLPL